MTRFETAMAKPSARLVNLLIGKSIIETVVVGALAVFTFMSVFPPTFHGWGEVTSTGISGWAVNDAAPDERIEVQLFVDGNFVGQGKADQHRPDVSAAGWAQDAWHGYDFTIPSQLRTSGQIHEARVYVLHGNENGIRKSLQLLGDPISFTFNEDGTLAGTSRTEH
jgi:hypothetical protein